MRADRIIFGTASVRSRTSYSQFANAAKLACSLGIEIFDTVPLYGRRLAQKYLARFISENPYQPMKVITKVGRVIKLDLKTFLILLLRRDFSSMDSRLICVRGSGCSLSKANILRLKAEIYNLFDSERVIEVLAHLPGRATITAEMLSKLDEVFAPFSPVGYSNPDLSDLNQFRTCYSNSFLVQVSYVEFLKRPDLQRQAGHLVINRILRFSRRHGVPTNHIFEKIDTIRLDKKTSFNFGLYSSDVMNDVVSEDTTYSSEFV